MRSIPAFKLASQSFRSQIETDHKGGVRDLTASGLQHQGTTVGVDEGVALSALDLLAGVVAPRPAGLRRRDALAVEHPRRRAPFQRSAPVFPAALRPLALSVVGRARSRPTRLLASPLRPWRALLSIL